MIIFTPHPRKGQFLRCSTYGVSAGQQIRYTAFLFAYKLMLSIFTHKCLGVNYSVFRCQLRFFGVNFHFSGVNFVFLMLPQVDISTLTAPPLDF